MASPGEPEGTSKALVHSRRYSNSEVRFGRALLGRVDLEAHVDLGYALEGLLCTNTRQGHTPEFEAALHEALTLEPRKVLLKRS